MRQADVFRISWKGLEKTMKRAPWHSTRPGDGVYHDNDGCKDGKFLPLYRAEGTAGRPLCRECARLDAMETPE